MRAFLYRISAMAPANPNNFVNDIGSCTYTFDWYPRRYK